LVINNLKSKSKDTKIELGTMIESSQGTETAEEFADTIIKNLEKSSSKFKSPKAVADYVKTLISKYK